MLLSDAAEDRASEGEGIMAQDGPGRPTEDNSNEDGGTEPSAYPKPQDNAPFKVFFAQVSSCRDVLPRELSHSLTVYAML